MLHKLLYNVAITVALKLVIASLRLDKQGSYATLVEPATSIPALFILAETVQQSSDNPLIGVAEEDALADYPTTMPVQRLDTTVETGKIETRLA